MREGEGKTEKGEVKKAGVGGGEEIGWGSGGT